MFYYKFLDLPKIPCDIIESQTYNDTIGEYPSRQCLIDGKQTASSHGVFFHANSKLIAWVNDNINLDVSLIGIRHQYGAPDKNFHAAHTDATRDYALLYVVDNAEGYLQFWKKIDCPIELDSVELVSDYTELEKITTVDTPNGSWYLVNGRVIHSVENITRTRITIQVNLKSL